MEAATELDHVMETQVKKSFFLQNLLQTFILGGGFYVKPSSTWVIKGIVSSALATGDYGCGVESFSVYTNVVKYLDWIYSVIA